MGKLVDALRAKYRTPEDVIRTLGLDASVLEASDVPSSKKVDVASYSRKEPIMAHRANLTRQGAITTLALAAILRPKLAQDQKINLIPIVGSVPAAEFGGKKKEIFRKIERACRGKLARDTSLGEIAEFLDMLDGHGDPIEENDEVPEELEKPVKEVGENFAEPDIMDADPMEEIKAFLQGKLDEEDIAKLMEMLRGGGVHGHDEEGGGEQPGGPSKGGEQLKKLGAATGEDEEGAINPNTEGVDLEAHDDTEPEHKTEWRRDGMNKPVTDQPPQFKGSPRAGGKMSGAHDTKKYVTVDEMNETAASMVRAATEQVLKTQREIRNAERDVQPYVGQLNMSFDSAEEVYTKALKIMGVKLDAKMHPSALKTVLLMQPVPGSRRPSATVTARQAADAANIVSFEDRYPDVKRIRLT